MKPYYSDDQVTLHHGDALDVTRELPAGAADCIVTSPPYFGLRDYGIAGQYGLEGSPAEYVETMRALFAELRRVLADDGTLWLNLGDSYSGSWGNQGHVAERDDMNADRRRGGAYREGTHTGSIRPGMPPAKNLIGVPWRVALALQDDGWTLRNAIIWHKTNGMPSSVTDRLSNRYEHVFLFSKSQRYWFDLDVLREPSVTTRAGALTWDRETDQVPGQKPMHRRGRSWAERKAAGAQSRHGLAGASASSDGGDYLTNEKGRNPGDLWVIPTQPFPAAHFAVMPIALARRCILAGCKPGGTVLDPFSGSGTTGLAAQRTGRRYIGIDLNAEYLELSLRTRLTQSALDFEAGAS